MRKLAAALPALFMACATPNNHDFSANDAYLREIASNRAEGEKTEQLARASAVKELNKLGIVTDNPVVDCVTEALSVETAAVLTFLKRNRDKIISAMQESGHEGAKGITGETVCSPKNHVGCSTCTAVGFTPAQNPNKIAR